MAGKDNAFASFVIECLQPLGPVSARRMFGGHGIYLHGTMFALIAYDQLYFKVDDGNRRRTRTPVFPTSPTATRAGRSACPTARRRARASTTRTSSAPGRGRPTPRRFARRSQTGIDPRPSQRRPSPGPAKTDAAGGRFRDPLTSRPLVTLVYSRAPLSAPAPA